MKRPNQTSVEIPKDAVRALVGVYCLLLISNLVIGSEVPILVREIYVPAERRDVWPHDGQQYLPIDEGSLDSLIEKAK